MEERGSNQDWVVVTTSDGQNYIGVVAPDWMEHRHKETDPYETKTFQQKILLGLAQGNSWITLVPAYEFHCPFGPNDKGQLTRRTLITNPDFVVVHKKVPLHLQINRLYFFDDLDEFDRKNYEGMIKQADETIEKAEQQMRQQAGLIALVPASAMPRPARA